MIPPAPFSLKPLLPVGVRRRVSSQVRVGQVVVVSCSCLPLGFFSTIPTCRERFSDNNEYEYLFILQYGTQQVNGQVERFKNDNS